MLSECLAPGRAHLQMHPPRKPADGASESLVTKAKRSRLLVPNTWSSRAWGTQWLANQVSDQRGGGGDETKDSDCGLSAWDQVAPGALLLLAT